MARVVTKSSVTVELDADDLEMLANALGWQLSNGDVRYDARARELAEMLGFDSAAIPYVAD